jgi:hypothetical protein
VTVDLAVLAQLPPALPSAAALGSAELPPASLASRPAVEVNVGLLEWLGLSRPAS